MRRSIVKLHAKPPRYTLEELEEQERKAREVEEALKLVTTSQFGKGNFSPSKPDGGGLNKLKQSVKTVQKLQQGHQGISSLLEDKRLPRGTVLTRPKSHDNQLDEQTVPSDGVNLEKFDCVLESEARLLELFRTLAPEDTEDLDLEDEEAALLEKQCGIKDEHYDLKLRQNMIEELLESMGAMKFDADLVAKDNSVTKILELKDDFIEEAFQSRVNESRHIQLMYDKFRRYRKREEDKLAGRLSEVKRAGNVDTLESKLNERAGQLGAVEREVAQKEKFYDLIQHSTQESSADQIRALLELSAQEDIEVLMKILETQQGEVLKKLLDQKNCCRDMTDLKKTLLTQYASLAESNSTNNSRIAQIKELKEEELKIRAKLSSAEAEKGRITAAVSKALKTILVTSLQNEGVQANLERVQNESADLEEAKKFQIKVTAARAEMEELQEKYSVMEKEYRRLNELEMEFKAEEEERKVAAQGVKSKLGMLAEDFQRGRDDGDGSDYTALFGEVVKKSLSVGRGVKVFMDKEEAIAEDALAALREGEEEEGGESFSIDDIALGHNNVNFAIKLGFKGKDKKAQDRMQQVAMQQSMDAEQFARDKVTYQSYGLHTALDQIEGIFKLIYIDPDIMETAIESDNEEEGDESRQESLILEENEKEREKERAAAEKKAATEDEREPDCENEGGEEENPRVKRQEAVDLAMRAEFEKKFAKAPIVDQKYEDIFRNKQQQEAPDAPPDLNEGSVRSEVSQRSTWSERRISERRGSERGEFDPAKRRDAERSLAASSVDGGDLDLLHELGVDEWGRKVHTKEAQRRALFATQLQLLLEDCTKVTDELTRRKVITSKVDTNLVKQDVEAPRVDVYERFSEVIHETPSFELGVGVYTSCQQLADAIIRRRDAIATVKQLTASITEKTKLAVDLVAEKEESRDYAYETFARNLKKLEVVQKSRFRYKSEVDVEKGERLRERLQKELLSWRESFTVLVQGTKFDENYVEDVEGMSATLGEEVLEEWLLETHRSLAEEASQVVAEEVAKEEAEKRAREKDEEERRRAAALKQEQLERQQRQEVQEKEEQRTSQENMAGQVGAMKDEKNKQNIESGRDERPVERSDSPHVGPPRKHTPADEGPPRKHTPAVEVQTTELPPRRLTGERQLDHEQECGQEEDKEAADWVSVPMGPAGGVSEEGSLSLAVSVRLPGVDGGSSLSSHLSGSAGGFGVEDDSVKEEMRVMLRDTLPMKVAPPPPSTQDDGGAGSRASSSRLRRFRYSVELEDVKVDAMDNTPIATPPDLPPQRRQQPLHHEDRGAMVFEAGGGSPQSRVPTAGATQWDGPRQNEEEERRFPSADEHLRLNSPRTGSGPYSPVPTIRVREVSPTATARVTSQRNTPAPDNTTSASTVMGAKPTARPAIGRSISITGDDDEDVVALKPLVTNYFVPKSLLKRTAQMVTQIKHWQKVATKGGMFQNDNKESQASPMRQDQFVMGGGADKEGNQQAMDDESSSGAHLIDAFWPETLKTLKISQKPSLPLTHTSPSRPPPSNHFPHTLPPADPPTPPQSDSKPDDKPDSKSDPLTDSLTILHDKLHDPNSEIFPTPDSAQAKRVSLSDLAFENSSLSKKEVAVEKAIITRKILRVSAWDRVVGMKTSFMKKYIQQELRDPRVVRVINSYNQMKRQDEYQDNFEYEERPWSKDDDDEEHGDDEQDGGEEEDDMERSIGEQGFVEVKGEGVHATKTVKVKVAKSMKHVLREKVQEIIRLEREKRDAEVKRKENKEGESQSGTNTPSVGSIASIIRVSVDHVSVPSSSSLVESSKASEDSAPRPSSTYFLDEEDEHDFAVPNATTLQDRQASQDPLADSILSTSLTGGSQASSSSLVSAPPGVGDGYSSSLNSAIYNLFDQGEFPVKEEEKNSSQGSSRQRGSRSSTNRSSAGGSDASGSRRERDRTGSRQRPSSLRTTSCGTDDGSTLLLAPPSPTRPSPKYSLKDNYGVTPVPRATGDPRFKLDEDGSEDEHATTAAPSPSFRGETRPKQPIPPPAQHNQALFPYQPPSALKASSSLLSPRRKQISSGPTGTGTRNKVLFTSDLVKNVD